MTYDSNTPSILWHDYETWGVSPKYDKPSQFAGIRTDLDLNIISEPEVFYCQPPQDYLPQPEACLVTGITPQKAQREGLTEAEFASRIHAMFSQPNTCVAGYNNIRFDDEVTRYMLYRNFYDPYAREWQHGNSRWDIIDMVRACYALRPDGINWPTNDEGRVSFRLELLTQANGISHEAAHDAMSDVYATIAMAKLIKEKQPKLYDFIFNLKNKRQVAELIDVYNMTPVVHTSSRISSEHGCTSWFAPVSYHPTNKNAVIAVDLAQDPEPLLSLSSEEIKARLYTKRQDLAEGELPIPVKLIHTNKCPIVAPAKTLLPENAARLNIPREQINLLTEMETIETPSGYRIYPFIGYTEQKTIAKANPSEVQQVVQMTIEELLATNFVIQEYKMGSRNHRVLSFSHQKLLIWGATAAILDQFRRWII